MQLSCQAARFARLLTTTLALTSTVNAGYDLVAGDENSVNTITKQMASDMLSFYSGNKPGGTVGLLPQPYYWWEAGAMFDSLINYWVTTGDDQYNSLVSEGLLSQTGARNDYIPIEQTRVEGNDDQGFWGFAAMSAAEYGLPNPPKGKPQWLALAQAVFNSQVPRWDDKTCGGGLRWQIFTFNSGIDYKNSISQATFFGLGARLALYTGNKTYGDWAEKTWDWMQQVDLIDSRGYIYDGINANNCTNRTPYQFTYNTGGMALGAAAMYNFTSDQKWLQRLQLVVKGADVFFANYDNIMTEVACETADRCNLDQQSFKAYLSRWFAVGAQWAPPIFDTVGPWIKTSAVAAAKQCSGGDNGKMCGLKWSSGKYDGSTGVGQQMAAMEVSLATRLQNRRAPYRSDNGGSSVGDVNAGTGDNTDGEPLVYGPLSSGNTAGAAFVTLALLLAWFYAIAWILKDERSSVNMFKQMKYAATEGRGGMGAAAAFKIRGRDAAKSKTEVAENGSNSSRTPDRNSNISERDIPLDAPIRIGHVRNASDVTVRRMSNMPLGWPRNSMANFPNNSETLSQRGSMFIGGTTSDAGSPRVNNMGTANLTPSASHGSVGMPPLSLHNSPQAHSSPVGMAMSDEHDAHVPHSPIH